MFSSHIKQKALQLGFEACGICKTGFTGEHAGYLQEWLDKGYHGEMFYMNRNVKTRCDSRLLVENAKSVIVVALNYFPERKQRPDVPQISYYAYGKDYHRVIKDKLQQLYNYIHQYLFPVTGRIFCDTAPILEKYHAQKAGLGWIGKNTQLIIPGKGSFFFLGEIVLDRELDYDTPLKNKCGNCRKCMESCPTQALTAHGSLNATRCISYLSIENKGVLENPLPENRLYGCDICNKACPHNQYAKATTVEEFKPSDAFLNLTKEQILQMDEITFNEIFKDSAVKYLAFHRI